MRRRLVVNVDHVATVRQARGIAEPDPVAAAVLAGIGGADGIVVHLREDRRHIQERDLRLLRETVPGTLCLEMAPLPEMLKYALEVRPSSVTLVPERREELTTEGGLDLVGQRGGVQEILGALSEAGLRSCLFVDPDLDQVKSCHRLGADAVEIHTGGYADAAAGSASARLELDRIVDAAQLAVRLGLEVGVGHGLDYRNVVPLAARPEIEEFSIGHAIVGRAILVGMERAVREMKARVG
ncbi:MAG: pyridoxine 5'-phosphate synthase [Myxococcota bacterium]|nr:pyridoxine 5'-phosphate synthase [Myxococcota bacterium]